MGRLIRFHQKGEPRQMQIEVADREIAQLLAALRNWQTDALNEDLAEAFATHFEDYEPLSDEEIDSLCERLNFAGEENVIKGGAY